jgi:hypothetical protein
VSWLFGDSFDHYTDLTTKYSAIGTAQAIGLGTGRFGTNGCRFTGAGGYLRKTLATPQQTPGIGALATMALALQRSTPGRFGFLNLWGDTRGHVVFVREDDGTITVRRQTGNEAPLYSGGPVVASTAAGVWPVNQYTSIEVGVALDATNGAVRVRVNGEEVLAQFGIATANPNAPNWTGWYVGLEKSIGMLDLDDLMLYTNLATGDGVQDFLGDLTGEVVVPQTSPIEQWIRNVGLSNASAVNERPPDNDLTYIEAGIGGQGDYYQMTRLARVSQGIRAIQTVITARKTGSPSRSIGGLIFDAQGTTYAGPPMPLAVTYQALVMPRPLTAYGGYWTMDQVNASLFGLQLTG